MYAPPQYRGGASIKGDNMGAENIARTGINFKDAEGGDHNFKLGMRAQAWLAAKHGTIRRVYSKLSGEIDESCKEIEKNNDGDMTECQLSALVDIVYAGLIRDYEKNKKPFSRDDALNLIDDLGADAFFSIISGNMKDALPDADAADPTNGQT
jgi:hypothetical protein